MSAPDKKRANQASALKELQALTNRPGQINLIKYINAHNKAWRSALNLKNINTENRLKILKKLHSSRNNIVNAVIEMSKGKKEKVPGPIKKLLNNITTHINLHLANYRPNTASKNFIPWRAIVAYSLPRASSPVRTSSPPKPIRVNLGPYRPHPTMPRLTAANIARVVNARNPKAAAAAFNAARRKQT